LPQDKPSPFTALQLTLDIGAEIPPRSSRRSINELAILLKGSVELILNGESHVLTPHSAIYFDLGVTHQWRNLGAEVAELVMVHPHVFQLFEQEEEDYLYARWKNPSGVKLTR
jgi:quercetin dioxygenase-like cupin family protein